jgi:carbon-monoxide dehydrogenase medium subunit
LKPAPFRYFAPESVEEAVGLLAEHGDDARPLAGGQSLVPAMNFRLAQPAVLVDLNRVADLDSIAVVDGGLRLGAMVRQANAERDAHVRRLAPLLAETLPSIAHPQIRNRGTVGGSLAHADPAAELPAVCVALEGRLRLRSIGGDRWVAASEFYRGLFETALEAGELLVEVELPAPAPRSGQAFLEIARRHGDFALVGVAAVVTLDEAGRCSAARVVLMSVGESPVSAAAAVAHLLGAEPSSERIAVAAAAAAHDDIDPPADLHASAAYRRHLAEVLVRRCLTTAVDRARLAALGSEGAA